MSRLKRGGVFFTVGVFSVALFFAACGGGGGSGGSVSTAQDFHVDSAGGTLNYISPDDPDIMVSLTIPAGAVSDGTVITVDTSDAISDSNVIPGLGFEFSPDGLSFAQSVDLVVTYEEAALPVGVDESDLKIHKWAGSAWQELPSTVDELNNTILASLSGFSLYFVFPEIPSIPTLRNWTHPVSVEDRISDNSTGFGQLAPSMADNGEAAVAWVGGGVFMTEYRSGTWTHDSGPIDSDSAINLIPSTGKGTQINEIALNMNEGGETVIAFNQYQWASTGAYRVYASLYDGSWNHPAYFSTDALSAVGPYASRPDANYPAAAIDGNGDVILVWHMKDAAGEDRFYKREYRSGVWSSEPIPASDALNPATTAGHMNPPLVAANESGEAVILWEEAGGYMSLEYRDTGGGFAWSSSVEVMENPSDSEEDWEIAMSDNGDIVAVGLIDYDLYVSEKRSGGSWSTPVRLNEEGNAVARGGHSMAMDGAGNTIVVWQQPGDTGVDHIYMREYSAAAASWSPTPSLALDAISPPAMSSTYQENFRNPHVAMGDNGDAVIVFAGAYAGVGVCGEGGSFPGYCARIFMTQRSGGGQWTHEAGTAQIISPSTSSFDTDPNKELEVAMDGEGNAVVVWAQFDESGTWHLLFMSEYR